MLVDAILPAGGRIEGAFATEVGTEIKALIQFGGQAVLESTISAVRASGRIHRIAVIGPPELAGHPATGGADAVLLEAESGPANIYRGLEWLGRQPGGHADRVVILTTDLPFLTCDAVAGFLAACPPSADISLPAVRREEFQLQFPGSANTYVALRDGEWTIGCAFLLNPIALLAHRAHIERLFDARKSQLAMAGLLGPLLIARFLTRRLALHHIESRCRNILGCAGAAVLGCDPVLAFDIDGPEDYRFAVQHQREEAAA